MAGNDITLTIRARDEASSVLGGLGKALGGLNPVGLAAGAGLAAVGAAGIGLAAGLGASVAAASGFEASLSAIKAVSGATAGEMDSLSKMALDLGKSTAFSASEAANGIEELIKGGLTVADVMGGGAAAALDLAAAGSISVADAAEIAANAVGQFGLKGGELPHVADLIAGAANSSAISVTDFKFSMAAAGAVAKTVGFSFDDTAVAIAELGRAGIKGSDAGTSLKTMFMSLNPNSKEAAKVMRELGIITASGANRFFDASGKVKSMAEVQQILQDSTKKLTDQQRLQALETMFGSDAIRAAAVLAKEGAEGYNEMAESMGKVTAASVGAERLNNLKGSFEQLKGSIETAAITVGMALTPALKQIVDGATGLLNSAMPGIEAFAKGVSDAIQQVGGAFNALSHIFAGGDAQGGFLQLATILKDAFGPEVSATVIGFAQILKTELDGAAATVRGIASAFQEGGIQGAIAATFGQETVGALERFGAALNNHVGPGLVIVTDALRGTNAASSETQASASGLAQVLDTLTLAITSTGEAFRILGGLKDQVTLMLTAIGVDTDALGPKFTNMSNLSTGGMLLVAEVARTALGTVAMAALRDVGSAIDGIGPKADSMVTAVAYAFMQMGNQASAAGRAIVDGLVTAINNGVGAVGQAARNLAQGAMDALKSVIQPGSPSKVATEYAQSVVDAFTVTFARGGPIVAAAGEDFIDLAIDAIQKWLHFTLEDGDFLNDWLTHIPEQFRGLVDEMIRFTEGMAADEAVAALEDWGSNLLEAIEKGFDPTLGDKLLEDFSFRLDWQARNQLPALTDIGKMLPEAVLEGLKRGDKDAIAYAAKMTENMENAIKEEARLAAGPVMEAGKSIAKAFWDGTEAGWQEFKKTLSVLTPVSGGTGVPQPSPQQIQDWMQTGLNATHRTPDGPLGVDMGGGSPTRVEALLTEVIHLLGRLPGDMATSLPLRAFGGG